MKKLSMPRIFLNLSTATLAFLLTSCGDDGGKDTVVMPSPTPTPISPPTSLPTPTPTPIPVSSPVRISFSFQNDLQGWQHVFADYPAANASTFEFRAGYEQVPPNFTGRSGLVLSSLNRSDDVFMGAYRLFDQLKPNTPYSISASILIASNEGSNCVGAGGAPGEAVAIKIGASSVAPQPNTAGFIELPLSKGYNGVSGRDMFVIGDISTPENGTTCAEPSKRYFPKRLSSGRQLPTVRSDADGRLWLIFGTDSAYEGRTTVYFLEGEFILNPI